MSCKCLNLRELMELMDNDDNKQKPCYICSNKLEIIINDGDDGDMYIYDRYFCEDHLIKLLFKENYKPQKYICLKCAEDDRICNNCHLSKDEDYCFEHPECKC